MRRANQLLARSSLCIALLTAIFASPVPAEAQRRVPSTQAEAQLSFAPVVKLVTPAVVNVFVKSRVRGVASPFANDPFFRRFFGERFGMPRSRVQNSLGSGVIVSPTGLIVTNTHVVKSRGTADIRIVLADKREFSASVILQDQKTDIAVLQVEGLQERLPFLEFADSDIVEVGDLVLAIGNPFGVGQTVTSGIISALARTRELAGRTTKCSYKQMRPSILAIPAAHLSTSTAG